MSILMLSLAASSGHISPIVPLALVAIGIILFIFGFTKYVSFRQGCMT